MKIKLNKGQTTLDLNIDDDKILDILIGKDVAGMGHDTINQIIAQGIEAHTPGDIAGKKVAVIIPDDTRLWARGDLYVPQIVKSLQNLGVAESDITIIIALGTHADMDREKYALLAGAYCAQNITIVNAANKNNDRLVSVGQTHKKTDLTVTREAWEADHIVIFGGILHHMAAGFGGGRKYILPGIAGFDAIQQNHSLAIRRDGTPHPMVRQAKLWGNPINEDMNDAARLFLQEKTCTYVAVAANGTGDIFHAAVGDLDTTFMEGCEKLNQACCVRVGQQADFAVISTGGHRTDTQLYQSTKALFNAVNIVKEGGEILFIAGCSDGVGNDTFAQTLAGHRGRLDDLGRSLAKTFNMPAYVAFRVMDILKRFRVTLVSDFSSQTTLELGFRHAQDLDAHVAGLPGKGYIIPYAENILPLPAEPDTP